ncbi:MAG TPA: DNA translocase FtsK 4TM domain-containing protein, partial [Polyangiaceae bacterium]|nr:DNA translocase FtsK 4TM domain-containing protein [Polyangiaceae bacterium]
MSLAGTALGDRSAPATGPAPISGPSGRGGSPLPANTRLPTVLGRGAAAFGRSREVGALVLWSLSLFCALALASYQGGGAGAAPATPVLPGPDWVGPVGSFCARAVVSLVGLVAWGLPVELMLLGIPLVRGKPSEATPGRISGDLLLAVVTAALIQVGGPGRTAFGAHPAGGLVGEIFGELARSLFSTAGSFLVGFACLGLIFIGRAAFSFIAFARAVASFGRRLFARARAAGRAVAAAWREARALERERREIKRIVAEPNIDTSPHDQAIVASLPLDLDVEGSDGVAEVPASRRKSRKAPSPPSAELPAAPPSEVAGQTEESPGAPGDELAPIGQTEPPVAPDPDGAPRARRSKKPPTIVDTSSALAKETGAASLAAPARPSSFELPSVDFLVAERIDPSLAVDRDKLLANANKLVETLAHYGVQGKVEDILPGPTVTTYEVSPAAGTKVSKVAGLADDLALALARKVRIVAPIPGKNRIGFELPNERRVRVVLRDLVEDRRFQSLDVPLPVVLGRDILGNPVYADLASMPHVIVAGATGAGKSVGLNVMLLSLLYRRSPDELRLLMVDPKVVELAPFDRIPHMLLPVVTDMKQAATALKWAVDEMERRYQLFADAGTKNVATYNAWVQRVTRGEAKNPNARVVVAKDHNGLPEEIPSEKGTSEGEAPLPEKLPWIVVVVDEFADLMMQQGKEVEAAVARLAQKARAAGMHVILATQRPSTDVITGTIKANFPTRIAYRVAQKVDSRTILDEQGAEHLLGMGDLLIKLNGTGETKRVQCPWVSEEEVQRVTDFLRTQGEPVYDDNILKPRDDEDGAADEADAEQDPL